MGDSVAKVILENRYLGKLLPHVIHVYFVISIDPPEYGSLPIRKYESKVFFYAKLLTAYFLFFTVITHQNMGDNMLNLFSLRLGNGETCSTAIKIDREIKNHKDLFDNWQEIIAAIIKRYSKDDLFNLHCTTAHHVNGGRSKETWHYQDIVPIDLDPINYDDIFTYIELISQRINVPKEDFVTVWSGHGLHIYIQVPPMDKTTFDGLRGAYANFVARLVSEITEAGLSGKCDSIWDMGRLLRLPGTRHVRPITNVITDESEVTECMVVYGSLKPTSFDLRDYLSVPKRQEYPDIQDEYVAEECAFIRAELANGGGGSPEPRWTKALGVVSFFKDSPKYIHAVSKGHVDYVFEDTDKKAQQRLDHGPRSCNAIREPECNGCIHQESGKSPVHLRRPPMTKTASKDTLTQIPDTQISLVEAGFSLVTGGEKGKPKKITRQPNSLREYFEQQHPYKRLANVERTVAWIDNYYQRIFNEQIEEFANKNYKPQVENQKDRNEFLKNINTHNVTTTDFFKNAPYGMINMQNGVYDIKTHTLRPHSPIYPFQYILPYGYTNRATCSTYDTFLDTMFNGNLESIETINEFLGYCLLGGPYEFKQALILAGEGDNGKSSLINAFCQVFGEGNYSGENISDMHDPFVSSALDGKLANIAEEEKEGCFKETGMFKKLTGMTPYSTRFMYEPPFTLVNRAKIIMTFNKMPILKDVSTAMKRRMLIIPCTFDYMKHTDKLIDHLPERLSEELPGMLNRGMDGLARLQNRRRFMKCAEGEQIIQDMIRNSNEIYDWAESYLTVTMSTMDRVSSDTLYNSFRAYTNNMRFTLIEFMKELNIWAGGKGLEKAKSLRNVPGEEKGSVVKGLEGVKIAQ